MERKKPHKNLELWTKVMEFVTYIYRMSKDFPREEEFGLKSQLRRAAVSIPSNISEGLTRWSKRDRLHFLNMAQSSLSEIDAQVEVSRRLGLINGIADAEANDQLSVIEMILNGLIRSPPPRRGPSDRRTLAISTISHITYHLLHITY